MRVFEQFGARFGVRFLILDHTIRLHDDLFQQQEFQHRSQRPQLFEVQCIVFLHLRR